MTESVSALPFLKEIMPLITTLTGALIAFFASFLSAKFTKDRESKLALESRDRERIEKIYRLLIEINKDEFYSMDRCIQYIHYGKKMVDKNVSDFPPLIEVEMLIRLYMPKIEEDYERLISEIHSFNMKIMDFRMKDYNGISTDIRKKDATIVAMLYQKVDENIKIMKNQIKELVKS